MSKLRLRKKKEKKKPKFQELVSRGLRVNSEKTGFWVHGFVVAVV